MQMQFTSQLEQGDWYIVAGWLCVVAALLLYGIARTLRKIRQLMPAPRLRARAKSARSLRAVPVKGARPAAVRPTQPAVRSHWCCVIEIVESGLSRTEAMSAWHVAAGKQIDAAEYALNRLITDCAKVMRLPSATPTEPPRPLRPPAALSEPLAA
jgi:hypothetical protein